MLFHTQDIAIRNTNRIYFIRTLIGNVVFQDYNTYPISRLDFYAPPGPSLSPKPCLWLLRLVVLRQETPRDYQTPAIRLFRPVARPLQLVLVALGLRRPPEAARTTLARRRSLDVPSGDVLVLRETLVRDLGLQLGAVVALERGHVDQVLCRLVLLPRLVLVDAADRARHGAGSAGCRSLGLP